MAPLVALKRAYCVFDPNIHPVNKLESHEGTAPIGGSAMRSALFHRLETRGDTRRSQQDMSQCSTGLLLSKFVRLEGASNKL
jgi:hypothetical protein